MRLERLQIHGFTALRDVDLALRELPAGVIAITGANGAGKTSLLEAAPGTIYRALPARDGADPVNFATGRDSFFDLEFTIDGSGAFRARLNLDGPKRQSDALLEQVLADGTRVALNDGKRSTYDLQIASRFPSLDLFINSSFAAQGRGDEFTRRKPSQRKDLFVEFLALQHYADMAKAAGEAAELAADARLRLTVQVEQLELATATTLSDELHHRATELQASGGAAEVRQQALRTAIAQLETRAALVADQVAAYAAATQRVRSLEAERTGKRTARAGIDGQRRTTAVTLESERARIIAKREADVAEVTKKIAGNQQILGMADQIRQAVATLASLEEQLAGARATVTERQAESRQAVERLRAVEQQLAALVTVEQRRDRAVRDTGILGSVPCGGNEPYASCQFLKDATAAQAQLDALNAQLAPKAALADQVGRHTADVDRLTAAAKAATAAVASLEAQRIEPAKLAKYDAPLADATAKIAGYRTAQEKAEADANTQILDAVRRHDTRIAELDAQATALDEAIAQLDPALELAQADLEATATGNSQAVVLQAELAAARAEWDTVTATLATVVASRQELDRRRQDIAAKRERLIDVRGRLAQVEQELVEWQDLAKALGKGGLPRSRIDAAGPTISALTNELLLSSFGPRFSLELVTQVAKADGTGMKDLFTVAVTDNEAGGEPRDISHLSGGEKTIVQEALMSAISLYVNARSPMPIKTLWRDETGAALDPENAVRYVAMLRKVRELGGFWHVYFISHNQAAAALADVQIRVADGAATIVYPPYAEAA